MAVLFGLGLGHALTGATVDPGGRLAIHLGWLVAGCAGWGLAIGYGSGLTDRGGVLGPTILASPAGTGLVVLARSLGIMAGLASFSALATLFILLVSGAAYGTSPAPLLVTGCFLLFRLLVVFAIATFFGRLLRPFSAALFGVLAAASGWIPDAPDSAFAAAGRYLLPRLPLLTPSGETGREVLPELLLPAALHTLAYAGAVLLLAASLAGPSLRRRGLSA